MQLQRRTLQLEMSPIAAAHAVLAERVGEQPLLDLSQAAPSYPPATVVQNAIAAAALQEETGRYAPSPGLIELRELFATQLSTEHHGDVDQGQVLITAGCNQAFCVVASALCEPGDEMILAEPFYFNHDMWLRLDGIVPRYISTNDELLPSLEEARAAITERTRAILLVTPGNPTGAIYPPALLAEFYELAKEHDVALIVDETYRNFRSESEPSHDLYGRSQWDETLITLHSFSKDLALPGYRVGAVVASPALIAEVLKLTDCVAICAPRIGQLAVIEGLRHASAWRQQRADQIAERLSVFRDVMAAQPGGFALASSGAFFGWVRHPFAGVPVGDVVRQLVVEADTLAIPGTAFTTSDRQWLRFSFANLEPRQLRELGDRLASFAPPF